MQLKKFQPASLFVARFAPSVGQRLRAARPAPHYRSEFVLYNTYCGIFYFISTTTINYTKSTKAQISCAPKDGGASA
ncbi:MAG: hypothetical protein J6M62_09765 [Selenomonadaceae bacterium]|nr:hypothetical protein [Selenomonadaceae bacterium]